jgi:hypothetical protein
MADEAMTIPLRPGGMPSMPSGRAQCYGTRQPVRGRLKMKVGSAWERRYGKGECSVCGKFVTCHKDGSAVIHEPEDECDDCGTHHDGPCDPDLMGRAGGEGPGEYPLEVAQQMARERDEAKAALTAALEQNERFAAEIARLRAFVQSVVDNTSSEDEHYAWMIAEGKRALRLEVV